MNPDEITVSEGKAYHAGDTVLLQIKRRVSNQEWGRMSALLEHFERVTGVHFVLLSEDVEVLEPKP